jgi:hypothetical protein
MTEVNEPLHRSGFVRACHADSTHYKSAPLSR